jgi:NADPH:quinone reductase-like Zn-dependent oxidoreductase
VATLFAQKGLSGQPSVEKFRSTLGGPLDGVLAEHVVLDAEGVVPVPAHLSDEEAACLPCAGVTAWNAVVELARVSSGDTVLVEGTGGVSIFALQFARLLGARVIVTSSSDSKLERARALGAWQTINYAAVPEWGREVRRITGGAGVDLVVDVGGAGTLEQAMSACRFGGQISFLGVLAGQAREINTVPIVMKRLRVQGVFVGHRESFERMNRAIAEHHLRPAVSRIFPLDQARAALEHLAAGGHIGKVCIRIGGP